MKFICIPFWTIRNYFYFYQGYEYDGDYKWKLLPEYEHLLPYIVYVTSFDLPSLILTKDEYLQFLLLR